MLIIDAYNVLNVQGVLPSHLAAPDLYTLIDLIQSSRYHNKSTTLVCDGPLPTPPRHALAVSGQPVSIKFNAVKIIFSANGQEADEIIEALLKHHQGSSSLTMVSSDRRLIRSARKWGGRPLDSAIFLRHLAQDHDRTRKSKLPAIASSTPLNRSELRYWMNEFGYGAPVYRPPEPPPDPTTEPHAPMVPAQPPPMQDPEISRLIKESGLEIDLAELDMNQWLSDIQAFPPSSY